MGDSSGGNLSAALCLMNRDRKGPPILLQGLVNPSVDLTCGDSPTKQGDEFDLLRWMALQYVKDSQDIYNPYVSPLLAPDLKGLPSTLIVLAESDMLRRSGQKYADRLQEAGVPVEVFCQKKIGHLAGRAAKASVEALESLDVVNGALRRVFS